jgi:hypothetical protein
MHVLVGEDLGRLVLRRVWPWHRLLACSRAGRLDRELAAGTSPEASAILAARAARLTSTEFRRDLAASLRRMLAAAGQPARAVPAQRSGLSAARPPRVPLRTSRISQAGPRLAELASRLLEPGPVPVRGVAMVALLLADGTGPLYREASRADLDAIAERAAHALAW